MTTMTIHAEDAFAVALRSYAARLGKSVNQAVKDLISPLIGYGESEARNNPWGKFYGCISSAEADCLRAVVAEQHRIDEDLWK